MIACTPAYRTIGIAAPIVVLLGRLLQGFSAGVEVGGASVYLSEMATPGHRGFYCAWQSASQQIAVVFAALLGVGLSAVVPPEGMAQWGWRVPFFIGCLIVPLLFWLRRSLAETEAFLAQKRHPGISEILASLASNWKIVGIGVLLSTMTTVSFYLITAYTPTFGIEVLHLTSRQSLMVTFCVGMSNFFWLPTGGAISDKVGRRPMLIVITAAAIVTAYPSMLWLVSEPSTVRLLHRGIVAVHVFRVVQRRDDSAPCGNHATGDSHLGIFSGVQLGDCDLRRVYPWVCTYLIHATGNRATPALWLSLWQCAVFCVRCRSWKRAV